MKSDLTPEPVFEFAQESGTDVAKGAREPWRVLLVDDDADVHRATVFAIGDQVFSGRSIEFLHAYSAQEARTLLLRESNLAFILLDVVMESDQAGLDLVDFIRKDAGLTHTRIVLRTGQPGYAPELETILRYDINDYKSKSELTQIKLLTLFATTLRSYQQLCAIEANKQGLSLIVRASGSFMQMQGLNDFAVGVMTQLAALIGTSPEGVVCAQTRRNSEQYSVLAAAGRYAEHISQPLESLTQPLMRERITLAFQNCRSYLGTDYMVLYFGQKSGIDMAVYIDTACTLQPVDVELIDVFCANLGACLHNQSLIDQLRLQAFTDGLLHLPNRARLIAEIEGQLARRTPDLAVCLMDVDDFSSVNELMGHRYGDQLLRALAQRIQHMVGEGMMLARVAGNTFGLLGNRQRISPDIVHACNTQPLLINDRPHRVTVTSGYVELDDPLRTGDDYLKNATIALKQAKKQARGQYVVYTSDIGTEARNRAQLLADLHHGFAHQHLFMMYQPQIDLASGALIGLEALMRWRKPDGALVPPDRFIPVAEQSGLIVPMGLWALQTACRDMVELIRQDLAPLRMAVNVSLEQFKSPDFFESVVAALASAGLPSNRLELEITESVAMLGSTHVTQQLSRLRAEQIAVSIDDFGTGYSSLSYLERLPLDRMKIDKAFVRQLGESGSARIAEMIAELGETLGLRVLAEGIEDRASWDALQAIGCHEGQGFFIAKPMEMAQLLPWIRTYRANANGTADIGSKGHG